MRVIAGKARGHKLFSLDGLHTRPTADRVKESVFSMIMNDIIDSDFLDLYSGSGAIGIEAISRGACSACFVDNHGGSIDIINKNLIKTKLSDKAEVIKADVAGAISRLTRNNRKFDIIYLDPPYYTDEISKTVLEICGNNILRENGIIIAELAHDQELVLDKALNLEISKTKNYNIAKIVCLRKGSLTE